MFIDSRLSSCHLGGGSGEEFKFAVLNLVLTSAVRASVLFLDFIQKLCPHDRDSVAKALQPQLHPRSISSTDPRPAEAFLPSYDSDINEENKQPEVHRSFGNSMMSVCWGELFTPAINIDGSAKILWHGLPLCSQ